VFLNGGRIDTGLDALEWIKRGEDGGAGGASDFTELFQTLPRVDAGLAASIFHFGEITVGGLKAELSRNGINVRI
jgi:cyclase